MFARTVSIHLKSNMLSDYMRSFENDTLPLLRKQKGFKDEITLSNPGSQDAVATYPQVLRSFERFIDGTPKVQTFEAVTSTFHNVAIAA